MTFTVYRTAFPEIVWEKLEPMLLKAYAEMYGDDSEAGPQDVTLLKPPTGEMWVMTEYEQIVGMASWVWLGAQGNDASANPESFPEQTVELKRLFVRDEWRNMGVAQFLDGVRLRSAREQGAKLAVGEAGDPQKGSLALRRSTGYVDVEPFGNQINNPESNFFGRWL